MSSRWHGILSTREEAQTGFRHELKQLYILVAICASVHVNSLSMFAKVCMFFDALYWCCLLVALYCVLIVPNAIEIH